MYRKHSSLRTAQMLLSVGLLWLLPPVPLTFGLPPLPDGERLRDLAEPIERRNGAPFHIGVATYDSFYANTNFTTVLAREYSMLTPENSMKMGQLVPRRRGDYNFDIADRHTDFAVNHGLMAHGHVLVWHNQQPDWLEA